MECSCVMCMLCAKSLYCNVGINTMLISDMYSECVSGSDCRLLK